ncbi:unnamed protein product [Orchesella dallaii]|uniref:Deltamethrin resistance protein prag01 domain-containing protein n=1 Tax=Orchesella dallaii TaxID=48710 RepID=A0ABP1PMV2_9HEXA
MDGHYIDFHFFLSCSASLYKVRFPIAVQPTDLHHNITGETSRALLCVILNYKILNTLIKMNSRVVAAASRAILASRTSSVNQVRNSSAYKPPANWYPPTVNELPIPQGSWQAMHDANQRKYNIHLAIGVSFFLFTLTVLKTSGLVTLNTEYPELPEK